MSVWRAKVRLNKLSSDWQIARALLEDEYKAYIDKALDKIRTRYEFVAHVLDVHRMCCSACTHTGFLAVRRSDRDAAVGGSASAGSVTVSQSGQHDRKMHVSASTQTTDGLHSDAPDMGLHAGLRNNNGMDNNIRETAFPLVMTCHGELQADASTASTEKPPNERVIKQEYDESSQEKDEEQGEEDTDEGWIDDGRFSSLQDQIPETHQRLHVADVQSNLESTNEFSDLLITQEGLSKEYCDVDMDSSRNQSTSHQGHEEGIPAQHIRSDVQSHLERTNEFSYLLIKEEGPCQEYCDVDMDSSRNESTSQQRHEEGIPTQHIRPDGKTLMTSNNEASTSTLHYDEHSPEGFSQDLCDADWTVIMQSNDEPSSSTLHYHEYSPESFSQDLHVHDASMDNNKNTRHTSVSEAELESIVEATVSTSTKEIINNSLSILQSYCLQKEVEFCQLSERFTPPELNVFLRTFYAEVRRGNGEPYAKRSMITLRYGLQRYFLKHRQLNICKDDAFQESYAMYKAILHKLKAEGKGAVQHRVPITPEDMDKIRESFDTTTPKDLQNKVFIDLMLHLPKCNRGREILRQMKKDDFAVQRDSANQQYVHVQDMTTKNHRGELHHDDEQSQCGRMYETGKSDCPVNSFLEYISHLNGNCNALWQRPKVARPLQQSDPWYDNSPLGLHTLGNKMSAISKQAQCSKVYTNHCLRATAVYKLDTAGFEARHIMSISGHKSEASIKHYSRVEDSKKRRMSLIIGSNTVNVE